MIHLYWHTDPPAFVERAAEQWSRFADTEVRVWTPDDLFDLVERARADIEGVPERDHIRHIANVARWHLLDEYGGVWADTDVWPLRNFNDFIDRSKPWCAGLGSVPTPFLCGGPAGHPLWARTLAAALDHPQGASPYASGGRLLQSMVMPDELELIPAKFFAERDSGGRLLPFPPGGRYARHEWRTSSQRRAETRR